MSELTIHSGPKFGIGEDIYWKSGDRWYAGYVAGWDYECSVSCIPVFSYCLHIFWIRGNIEITEYDEDRIRRKPKFKKGDKVWAEMTYFGIPVMVKAVITSDAHIGPKESVTEWEYSGVTIYDGDNGVVNRTFKESQLLWWDSDSQIPHKDGTCVLTYYKVGSQVDVKTYFGFTKAYCMKKGTIVGACVAHQYRFKYLVRYENGDMELVAYDRIHMPLLGKNTCMCYIDEYVNSDVTVTKEVCDKIYQGGKEKMDDKDLKELMEALVHCNNGKCSDCSLDSGDCVEKQAKAAKEVLRRMEEKEKQEAKFGDGITLDIKLGYPRKPKCEDFRSIINDLGKEGRKIRLGFKGKYMDSWKVAWITEIRQRSFDSRWEFIEGDDDSFVADETCEVRRWPEDAGFNDAVYCKVDNNEFGLIKGRMYLFYHGQVHKDLLCRERLSDKYIWDENDEFFKKYFVIPTGKAVNVDTCVKNPELLNGTALCTESCEGFTEGTLYKFVNGRTIDDNGDVRPKNTSIHTTDPDWLLRYRLIMLK